MTTREKVLVYMLMIVCIVGGGYRFLIDPMVEKVNTNTQARYELYAEQEIIDKQVRQLDDLRQVYINNTQSLDELRELIGIYKNDETFEEELRAGALEHNVGFVAVEFSDIANDYLDETTTEISGRNVTLNVYGSITNFLTYVEYINNLGNTILVGVSVSKGDGVTESYYSSYGVYSEAQYNLSFMIFSETEFPMEIAEFDEEVSGSQVVDDDLMEADLEDSSGEESASEETVED